MRTLLELARRQVRARAAQVSSVQSREQSAALSPPPPRARHQRPRPPSQVSPTRCARRPPGPAAICFPPCPPSAGHSPPAAHAALRARRPPRSPRMPPATLAARHARRLPCSSHSALRRISRAAAPAIRKTVCTCAFLSLSPSVQPISRESVAAIAARRTLLRSASRAPLAPCQRARPSTIRPSLKWVPFCLHPVPLFHTSRCPPHLPSAIHAARIGRHAAVCALCTRDRFPARAASLCALVRRLAAVAPHPAELDITPDDAGAPCPPHPCLDEVVTRLPRLRWLHTPHHTPAAPALAHLTCRRPRDRLARGRRGARRRARGGHVAFNAVRARRARRAAARARTPGARARTRAAGSASSLRRPSTRSARSASRRSPSRSRACARRSSSTTTRSQRGRSARLSRTTRSVLLLARAHGHARWRVPVGCAHAFLAACIPEYIASALPAAHAPRGELLAALGSGQLLCEAYNARANVCPPLRLAPP
jgi:hypothetical protein